MGKGGGGQIGRKGRENREEGNRRPEVSVQLAEGLCFSFAVVEKNTTVVFVLFLFFFWALTICAHVRFFCPDIKLGRMRGRRASWERRTEGRSHRKWQTCWPAWLNSPSLFRVVNYLHALKNLSEREGEGDWVGGKINAMNGGECGVDGDRKKKKRKKEMERERELGGEQQFWGGEGPG